MNPFFYGHRLMDFYVMWKMTPSPLLYCPLLQHCIPPLSETLLSLKGPSHEYSVFSDWSSHTRITQQNKQQKNSCQEIDSYLPNDLRGIGYANVCRGDVVWCHKVTELNLGAVTSVGERGFVGALADLFDFQDLLHSREHLRGQLTERE